MALPFMCSVLTFLAFSTAQPELRPPIDFHQHLFSPAAAALSGIKPVSAADLVAVLDAAGIRRALVLSVAYQFGNPNKPVVDKEYERVKAENDWTSAQVAAFPDRLRGFCSVNPLKDYALEEIARCARDAHLRTGLKLHFGNSDVDLENPQHLDRVRQVFRAANGHGMALVVHLRSSVTRQRPYGAAIARAFLNDVLPSAPDVPVQVAHLAGAGGYDDPQVDDALGVFVAAVAAGDRRMGRVWFDASGIAGLGQWTAKLDLIAGRIRQLGAGRVLYGSDGTVGANTPAVAWAAFRQLPLSDAEFRTIAGNIAPHMR